MNSITTPSSGRPVGLSMLMVFALPGVVLGLSQAAFSVIIPAFYVKYTAATLAGVGAALFAARIIEAVIDPMIGHLSDITRGRFGTRKPWVLGASFIAPLPVLYLFAPETESGNTYFLIWSAAYFLAWTMINIPYRAWATELSRDYQERSKIFTTLGMATLLGAVLFAISPFLPLASGQEMGPEVLAALGLIMLFAYPLSAAVTTAVVPQGETPVESSRPVLREMIRSIRGNRPFMIFLAAYMLGGVGQGMILTCFYFYLDVYLEIGHRFPIALVAIYCSGLLGMPLWLRLIQRWGKHRVWALGWGLAALVSIGLAFVPVGEPGFPIFLVLVSLYGVAISVELFAPYAVLGDVIDYDFFKTGANRAGNYNALALLAQKANIAVGGAVAFFILDGFGFDVTGQHSDSLSRFGFLLAFVGVPVALYGLSCVFIWRFPIDRSRHAIILRWLERRTNRAGDASVESI